MRKNNLAHTGFSKNIIDGVPDELKAQCRNMLTEEVLEVLNRIDSREQIGHKVRGRDYKTQCQCKILLGLI